MSLHEVIDELSTNVAGLKVINVELTARIAKLAADMGGAKKVLAALTDTLSTMQVNHHQIMTETALRVRALEEGRRPNLIDPQGQKWNNQ